MKNINVSKKIYLLPLAFLFALNAKGQEFLTLSKDQIKNKMVAECGKLKLDRLADDMTGGGPFNLLVFTFSKKQAENNPYLISFFLLHNKCFKYRLEYNSDES